MKREVTVLRARNAGGYGLCATCLVPNSATYGVFDPEAVEWRTSCAMHLADIVDYFIRMNIPSRSAL